MELTKEKTENQKGFAAVTALLFLLTVAAVLLLGVLAGESAAELIRNGVLTSFGTGCVVFAFFQSHFCGSLNYDNDSHPWRFFCIYLICFLLALLFILLPVAGWPFLVLGVALMLFSNEVVAVAALSNLLLVTVHFSGAADSIFLLYLLSSVAGILLFAKLDDNFQVFSPILISFVVLFTEQLAVIVLFTNESLHPGMFIIPVMNLFMNGILLLVALKYFSSAVIHKYRETLLEINDPEGELLAKLKTKSKTSYYRCIHTAYLCERTAVRLGLDKTLCKLGGYYFRLQEFCEDGPTEALKLFADTYHFPPQVLSLLGECNLTALKQEERYNTNTFVKSREAIVVLLSDEMIRTLMYLFEKDKNVHIDYHSLVNTIIAKKTEKGLFKYSDLSFAELEEIRSSLIGEELYYDFLR